MSTYARQYYYYPEHRQGPGQCASRP